MNKLKSTTALALAIGLGMGIAAAGPASAATGSNECSLSMTKSPADPKERFRKLDADGSGDISKQEYLNCFEQASGSKPSSEDRKAADKDFDTVDINRDQMITEDEFNAGTGAGAATAGAQAGKSAQQADKSSTSQMSSDKTSGDGAQPGTSQVAGGISAEELVGRNVVNRQGENVGEVEGVVIQPKKKEVHAVISVGGFLGIGDREVAIPLKELEIGQDNVTLMSQQTKEDLQALPEYDKNEWQPWKADSPTKPQSKSQ